MADAIDILLDRFPRLTPVNLITQQVAMALHMHNPALRMGDVTRL